MKIFKIFSLVLIIFFFKINPLYSEAKLAFIDLDIVLKKSNIGKIILKELDALNENNISELQIKEKELKTFEEEIKLKKNIISKEEFDNEINIFKKKVKNYKKIKDKMVNELEIKKNDELNNFFNKVNPIIQNYMDKNSIEIVFERKNIFIGKKNSDITAVIVDIINKELN